VAASSNGKKVAVVDGIVNTHCAAATQCIYHFVRMFPVCEKSRLKSEENDGDGQKAIQLFEDKRLRAVWDE